MNFNLSACPIRTSVFHQGDDLIEFILRALDGKAIKEKSILAITTKIVSLAEGRVVAKKDIDKKSLIRQEADFYLGEIGQGISLTIKQGLLMAAAGIDESNSENGDYILHPRDLFVSAQKIRHALQEKLKLQDLGIILTDSRTNPLRLGVMGVGLAWAGFYPLRNLVGTEDIFGRPLKMTKVNLVDSLAAMAVLMMGEAAEQCPLCLIENAAVEFTDDPSEQEFILSPEDDVYRSLYQALIK